MLKRRVLEERGGESTYPPLRKSKSSVDEGKASAVANSNWFLRIFVPPSNDDDDDESELEEELSASPSQSTSYSSLNSPTQLTRSTSSSTADSVPSQNQILSPHHFVVLASTLEELAPYNDNKVDWLIRISSLLFGPRTPGHLSCPSTDDSAYWLAHPRDPLRWRRVSPGEAMLGVVYEFVPDTGGSYDVTKRMLGRDRSETTNDLEARSNSTRFRDEVRERDGNVCFLTGMQGEECIASHLVPKRRRDEGVREIVESFGGLSPAEADLWSRYDSRLGLFATKTFVDTGLDKFKLGLFGTSVPNRYQVHVLSPLSEGGAERIEDEFGRRPKVHNTFVSLVAHTGTPLPPSFIVEWHYLQCAYQRFGTFATRSSSKSYCEGEVNGGDGDGDEDDSEEDNYPTRGIERLLRTRLLKPYVQQQLSREVGGWVTRVGA